MKTQVFKLATANGFNLYEREKTKMPGYAPWPKYFINGEKYFSEFKTKRQAQAEFKKLTTS